MQRKISNKIILGAIIVILSLLSLFLYTKIDSVSMASSNPKEITEFYLSKYVNYNENWGKGTLLQYNLKTGIEYEEGQEQSVIKNSVIKIQTPQLNGKNPSSLSVINKGTKLTNGDKDGLFYYSYDNNSGVVTITVTNEDQEGNPVTNEFNKDAKDEFEIISNYSDEAYNGENAEREIMLQISTTRNLFANDSVIENKAEYKATVSENNGEVLSLEQNNDDIYNGQIKSNIINGTDYSTKYREYDEIQIGNKQPIDTIEINTNSTNTVYKSTEIRQRDLVNVLGENGSVEILDLEGNVLATLNKDNTVAKYENSPESIVIKTSNIQNIGLLKLENIKEIKTTENIEKIKATKKLIVKKGETLVYEHSDKKDIEIKNSETKVDVHISKDELTNETQNELVFDIMLNNNNEKYNLFKNPTIKIDLPKEAEKVILGESSLIQGNGLTIQNVNLEENENGKSIVANLAGTQTQYEENEYGIVTTLRIKATVILKQDIEIKEETINVSYTNEFTLDGSTESGIITKNIRLKNYRENEVIESIIKEEQNEIFNQVVRSNPQTSVNENLKLEVAPTKGDTVLNNNDVVYEGEYIKYNIKLENTSDQDIENVKVIASIPEGVTYGELYVDDFTNLGQYKYNFNGELREKIIEVGIIKAGESVTEFYEVKVNNIDENEKEITTNIKSYIGETENSTVDNTLKIQKAGTQAFMGAFYYSGQWTYYLNLYSNENKEVTVNMKVPQALSLSSITYATQTKDNPASNNEDENAASNSMKFLYRDFLEGEEGNAHVDISDENVITVNLNTNQYYEFNFYINQSKIQKIDDKNEIELVGYTEVIDNGKTYTSNENRFKTGYDNIKVTMTSKNSGEKLKYEDELEYEITVENVGGTQMGFEDSSSEFVAVNLSDFLPNDINPQTITYNNWILKETEDLENGALEYEENKEIVEDISGATYDEDNNKLADIDVDLIIPQGQTIKMKIKATAGLVYEETQIDNSATASGSTITTKKSNTVTSTILPYNYEELIDDDIIDNSDTPDDPDTPVTPENPDNPEISDNPENTDDQEQQNKSTFSISGVAWHDENRDGQRQSNEKYLDGITVSLIDLNNSSIIKETKQTKDNGLYRFADLEKGKYIVVFRYDTSKYKPTEYKKENVYSIYNSDVVAETITLNGEKTLVGVTDTIELNESAKNIDLGLVENEACDFKVEKYISKITVKTKKGTKEYTYDNKSIAKAEIRAKEIDGANVTIEYKIIVTNVGKNPGKVGKVIDTLPEGLTFSSKLNSNWIKKSNGEIINASLANRSLNVGESEELTLIATKQMTSESTGIFTNNAQITDISSTNNTEDSNSENNSSKADVILSVSTGIIIFISIFIIIVIALTIALTIIIKNKKIDFKKLNKISMILAIVLIALFGMKNIVTAAKSNTTTSFTYEGRIGGNGTFSGGPNGVGGWCLEHGIEAAGQAWDGGWPLPWGYSRSYSRVGVREESGWTNGNYKNNFDYSLNKQAPYTAACNNLNNDYMIYGPFIYNLSANVKSIGLEIKNKNNNNIASSNNWNICDKAGNSQSLSKNKGNNTFYVKIKKTTVQNNGISIIKLNTSAEGQRKYDRYKTGYIRYVCPSEPGTQTVETKSKVRTEEEKDKTTTVTKTHSIEWKVNACLQIIKQDAHNSDIKLNGVTIKLERGSYSQGTGTWVGDGWSQTYTTNDKGEITIQNLTAGKHYKITETSNPNYGYDSNINKNRVLDYVYLYEGQPKTVLFYNFQDTGNLKIQKQDRDSGEKLAGVKFKIKNSSNKYIRVTDMDNNTEVSSVTGKIYLSNMKTVNNQADATEFITDEKGLIEIYNILSGTYTVEETSVGENSTYEVDGNYISWQDSNNKTTENSKTAQVTVARQKSYKTLPSTTIIEDNQKTIDDGIYSIETAKEQGKLFDITGNASEAGADAIIYHRDNRLSQRFYIRYIGGGLYKIQHIGSGYNVEIQGNNDEVDKEKHVQVWYASNSNDQKWYIEKETASQYQGKGYYKIRSYIKSKSENKAMYMDVQYGNTADETPIILWTSNNNLNQKFAFKEFTTVNSSQGYVQRSTFETTLTAKNKRKYTNITGEVWEEDLTKGKNSKLNSIMENNDIRLQNIKVSLKDRTGKEISTTYTNQEGYYEFKKVEIENLDKYYVEFEYDGEIYTTVKSFNELSYTQANAPEGTSKVQEESTEREKLDKSYSHISGNRAMNTTNNTSQSTVSGVSGNFNVNYTSNSSDSAGAQSTSRNAELNQSQLSENGNTRNVNKFSEYENYNINKVTATTDATGFNLLGNQTKEAIRRNKNGTIEINCGLVKREQPNLSVYTDLVNVTATINGYTHNYHYDLSKNYPARNEITSEETFRLDVHNGSKKYVRQVYKSDIDNGCEIYLTYRITMKNYSTTLKARVHKIANYYDARYEIAGLGTTEECTGNKLTSTDTGTENGYKKAYLTYNWDNNEYIDAEGNSKEIYVKYKLNPAAVQSIMSGDKTFYSVSEIQDYASYYGENTYYHDKSKLNSEGIYAGIDNNSAPGNTIVKNENNNQADPRPSIQTFEDDTMLAPAITITLTTNERTINGNVFEDAKTNDGLGNGEFDDNDREVGNVKVDLIKYGSNPEEVVASTQSETDGSYSISGITPGKYYLKFTYGDGSTIYKNGNAVEENLNPDNYKSTIITSGTIKNALETNTPSMWYKEIDKKYSSAIDDEATYSRSMNTDQVTQNKATQDRDVENSTPKVANSAPMNVRFELVDNNNDGSVDIDNGNTSVSRVLNFYSDGSGQVETVLKYINDNICFGIVERPKQDYEVKKEISSVEFYTQQEQQLNVPTIKLDNTPFNRSKTINIQVDNSLITGATLKLKYKVTGINKSEKNYPTREYYYYGNTEGQSLETLKISKVIDYMDNDLIFNDDVTKGNIKTSKITTENANGTSNDVLKSNDNTTTLSCNEYLDQAVIENCKNYNNVLILESDKTIAPNEEVTWEYSASRLITNNERLEYNNYAECIEIKTQGKSTNRNKFGNFIPDTENIKEVNDLNNPETDYYASELDITSPTGDNRNTLIIIIGITALIVLEAGIVIIKKKVLK